jgi:hypothetical protein
MLDGHYPILSVPKHIGIASIKKRTTILVQVSGMPPEFIKETLLLCTPHGGG